MNDPKLILQQYLIMNSAPAEVLAAMRALDEQLKTAGAWAGAFWFLFDEIQTVEELTRLAAMVASDQGGTDPRVLTILKESLQDTGRNCDHEVGVCFCAVLNALETGVDPNE